MERKVHFYSGPGLKLVGALNTPADYEKGEGKRPGLVLCPGPGTGRTPTMADYQTPGFVKPLVEAGYVVLTYYHRGVGESEGQEYRFILMEQAEDICNAITFLQQQEEVDASRIGLLGIGCTGGANASYVAGINTQVQCMVSLNGFGDGGRWHRAIRRYWEWQELLKRLDENRVTRVLTGKSTYLEVREVIVHDPSMVDFAAKVKHMYPEYKFTERLFSSESVESWVNYRPETMVDRISPRAAMWICTASDTLVPIDESRSMYEKAREPKKLVILEGGWQHEDLYYDPALQIVMAHAIEWFDTHLKTG